MDKAEQRAKKTAETLTKVSHALLGLGAALTGVAALAVREAAQFETLEVRLQAVFNSTEKGTAAFKELQKVAAKTPYSLQSVVQAGTTLAAYMGRQKDQAVALTASIADLAAFMGDDIPQAASAFGRAFAAGAGAADMLRERGVLALVADFAKMKHGIEDLTKLTLPEFRKILIEAIRDPSLGIAGATEKLSATFAGAMSNMKDALSQLAAAFGKELLPALTGAVKQLTDFLTVMQQLPQPIRAVVSWIGALTGALALASGSLLQILLHLKDFKLGLGAVKLMLGEAKAIGLGGFGLLGALAALAWFMHEIDRSSRGAGQAARDLAAGGSKELEARIATVTARLERQRAKFGENHAEVWALESALERLNEELAAANNQTGLMAEVTTSAADANKADAEALEKRTAAIDAYLVKQEQARLSLERVRDLLFAPVGGEAIPGGANVPSFGADVAEAAKVSIDWLGALQQAAGAAGQSLGQMFSDMAEGAEVNLGKVIEGIAKLIAKLLIMAALYAIPGVGPILSQFAGGFFGAVGFDNPVSDTKAWRWGADFVRQFDQGMSSMLSGGLSLPQMQPAAIGGMGGGLAFDIHVHEPGPDTYVKVVRRGVAAMSDNEAFGLYRNKLGRASDRWGSR